MAKKQKTEGPDRTLHAVKLLRRWSQGRVTHGAGEVVPVPAFRLPSVLGGHPPYGELVSPAGEDAGAGS